jgi:hypothetical protein
MRLTKEQADELRKRKPWMFPEDSETPWTEGEEGWLKANYPNLGQSACAERLHRSIHSVRSKASRLGLALDQGGQFFKEFQERAAKSKVGKKLSAEHVEKAVAGRKRWWDGLSQEEQAAFRLAESERMKEHARLHPKKGRPDAFRDVWSSQELMEKRRLKSAEASQRIWSDPSHPVNSEKYRQRLSDAMSRQRASGPVENCYSRVRRGFREDLGIFVRSSWEANYARYLNFLIAHEGNILKWQYEPETFWFEAIRRGVRSYKPDFKVSYKDGHVEYHEVKGWLTDKSKTALSRMVLYHPAVQIVLIDSDRYRSIEKQCQKLIQGWEKRR